MGLSVSTDPYTRLTCAQVICSVMTMLSRTVSRKEQIKHLTKSNITPRAVNVLKKVLSNTKINLVDLSRDVLFVSCSKQIKAFKSGAKKITLCFNKNTRSKRIETRCDLFLTNSTLFLHLKQSEHFEERWIEVASILDSENGMTTLDSKLFKIFVKSFQSRRDLNDLRSLTIEMKDRKTFQSIVSTKRERNDEFDFSKSSSVSVPIIIRPAASKTKFEDLSSDIESVTSEISVRSKASRLVRSRSKQVVVEDDDDDDDDAVDDALDDDDATIDESLPPSPKQKVEHKKNKTSSLKTSDESSLHHSVKKKKKSPKSAVSKTKRRVVTSKQNPIGERKIIRARSA